MRYLKSPKMLMFVALCLMRTLLFAGVDGGLKCGVDIQVVASFGQPIPVRVWVKNDGEKVAMIDVTRIKYTVRCVKPFRQSETRELYSMVNVHSINQAGEKATIALRHGEGFFFEESLEVPESGLYSVFSCYENNGAIIKGSITKQVKVEEGDVAIEKAIRTVQGAGDAFERMYALRCVNIMAGDVLNNILVNQLKIEKDELMQITLCEVLLERFHLLGKYPLLRLETGERVDVYQNRAKRWLSNAKKSIYEAAR